MVPNPIGSDAPAAAFGVPSTGGQYVAQAPLQLDLVEVSIENQYSVRPWALVSTVPMLVLRVWITAVVLAVLPAAVLVCGELAGALSDAGAALLPQAVMTAAAAASNGTANHRLRIVTSPIVEP
jgi:hypothetical protein